MVILSRDCALRGTLCLWPPVIFGLSRVYGPAHERVSQPVKCNVSFISFLLCQLRLSLPRALLSRGKIHDAEKRTGGDVPEALFVFPGRGQASWMISIYASCESLPGSIGYVHPYPLAFFGGQDPSIFGEVV